jgi:hypothetical protein
MLDYSGRKGQAFGHEQSAIQQNPIGREKARSGKTSRRLFISASRKWNNVGRKGLHYRWTADAKGR